jgi:hypothetical protein
MTDRWVRVMADYCSDGLWQRDGCMMSRDELPISAELRARHAKWCQWYESNNDYEGEAITFDYWNFSIEGEEIARLIKDELPDWTVIYFDEKKCLSATGTTATDDLDDVPRDLFEYEIV